MPLKPWKKIDSKILFKNKWWTYILDNYLLPNGTKGEYHFVHTSGSSFIIPVCDDGKIMMVKQYRYLNDRESLEFPGGGINEGEKPENIAQKELIEETGFDADLEKIGIFNPYNGVTNEICHVYIGRNLKSSVLHKKDESEDFEFYFLTPDEIEMKISTNEIYDGMTLAAWSLARKYFFK
jgi:ADP-ribose pyrophosphatase